jgi:DNA (cytosine-5)-methyltransferase 1
MAEKTLHSVSLFSNCGAGDLGYAKAGFCFDVMAELDKRRLEVCLLNHPGAAGIPNDLRQTWKTVVTTYRHMNGRTPPALLAACPPCQGMSSARSHRGRGFDPDAGMQDDRNLLVTVIARVARALRPRVLAVENVLAFLTRQVRHPHKGSPVSASRLLIDELADDYEVFPFQIDLCDYGVPQSRKRTFFTFFRRDEQAVEFLRSRGKSPYPIPRHAPEFGGSPVSVRDALESFGLPSLDAASAEKAMSAVGRGLHSVAVWSHDRYEMVAAIPPHTGKGAWDNDSCKRCGRVDVGPLDAKCPRCGGPLLRPLVADPNAGYRLITGFRNSTYTRMRRLGWSVLAVWECELARSPGACAARIQATLRSAASVSVSRGCTREQSARVVSPLRRNIL